MDRRVVDFLGSHRISVLSILMPDGSIHGATLHFAWDETNEKAIFLAEKSSKKARGLGGGEVEASLVIGFSEEEWMTVQMSGKARSLPSQDDLGWQIYSEKFKGADKNKTNSNLVLIEFEPREWKLTRVKPSPPVVISSETRNK